MKEEINLPTETDTAIEGIIPIIRVTKRRLKKSGKAVLYLSKHKEKNNDVSNPSEPMN